MPDSGVLAPVAPAGMPAGALAGQSPAPARVPTRRFASPLLRRILLVNALPLALLVATLLYLDQYQNGLLEAEVAALREQSRIYASALSESATRDGDGEPAPQLVADVARPLLRRLLEPTPNAQARLYALDGTLVADSRVREGQGGAIVTEPLPAAPDRGPVLATVARIYDEVLSLFPHAGPTVERRNAAGADWQPDVKEELRMLGQNTAREMPPYIRRTGDDRLLVTVAEPVRRDRRTAGIVLLTREAREVDDSLFAVRLSILGLFALALALTVALSWYLSRTIARPILNLAGAAERMREESGRKAGAVPPPLLARTDEVGALAHALAESAAALWARMDATERFAADVAHEIKNPLTSIRSAIETLRRIEDPARQRRLLAVIADDVQRLDRLISDISDASRVDAELSRSVAEPVDVAAMLRTLADIAEATRQGAEEDGAAEGASEAAPRPVSSADIPPGDLSTKLASCDFAMVLDVPDHPLLVRGVEGRLVQVLRNLIGNAESFSPPGGRIWLRARETGSVVEVSVEDEGPGIPEGKLEHIFDRFYSERPKDERFGQHSGLGLSISRQIVEALKGRISAENRRDEGGKVLGARFVVRLPRA